MSPVEEGAGFGGRALSLGRSVPYGVVANVGPSANGGRPLSVGGPTEGRHIRCPGGCEPAFACDAA